MSVLAVITPTWDTKDWVGQMQKALPHINVRGWPDLGDVSAITFAACWMPPPGLLASLPRLKLILSLGAGVDAILHDETFPRQVPLVRVVDKDLTARMSEYVLLHVLMHAREQRRIDANQRQAKWDSFAPHAAKHFCVGVMGLGELGQDACAKLATMGFRLRGWSRSAKQIAGVACFSGADQLDVFLAGTDILVCLLPATPDTTGILNRKLFSALSRKGPFGAPILINAGRGQLQNEADILACLNDGTLHAATLDVFNQEPLPSSHPFWLHPKVSVSPHGAAYSEPAAICAYVAQQINDFTSGKPLANLVDVSSGY